MTENFSLVPEDAPEDAPVSKVRRRCQRCGGRPELGELICPVCEIDITSPDSKILHKPYNSGRIGEFFKGVGYFLSGFQFLLSHRSLWAVAIVPTIINVIVLGLTLWWAIENGGYLTEGAAESILEWKDGGFWDQTLYYTCAALLWTVDALWYLIIPLIVAYIFSFLGKFLFMPFMEVLSEKTEKIYLGHVVEKKFSLGRFLRELSVSLFNGLLVLVCQIAVILLLLPLNAVPFVGSVLWFLIPGCFFASMDYTDMNFIRRHYDISGRLQVWLDRKWRFLGFGFAFFFFLGTPILNILTATFVIPVASVGGTLLFLELDRK